MTVKSKVIVAAVALAISCFIVTNTIIKSQPITIVIDDEIFITLHTPVIYQEREVLIVAISSFVAGISTVYLYLEASKKPSIEPEKRVPAEEHLFEPSPRLRDLDTVNTALRVLRGPRRRLLEIIVDNGGEILQKDLYLETGFSKAKISRTLKELESRNIIQRKTYGSTKKITLSDWMKRGTTLSQEKSEK